MATTPSNQTLSNARPYWLQRTLYTELITLTAGQTESVFTLRGWNPSGQVSMVAELSRLGISQIPGIQLTVTADTVQDIYDADTWGPGLDMQRLGHRARRNLSLSLLNTTAGTIPNIQVLYELTCWRMPVEPKIMLGYATTAQEKALAVKAGLSLDPTTERGLLPYTLDQAEERTYANRRVSSWLGYARPVQGVGATQASFHQATAQGNDLLLWCGVAGTAPFGQGVVLSVDRDDNADETQIHVDMIGRRGRDLFMPGSNSMNFKLAATAAVAGQIPMRLDVISLSLSTILRVRMGQLDATQLATLLPLPDDKRMAAAQQTVAYIQAGVF